MLRMWVWRLPLEWHLTLTARFVHLLWKQHAILGLLLWAHMEIAVLRSPLEAMLAFDYGFHH